MNTLRILTIFFGAIWLLLGILRMGFHYSSIHIELGGLYLNINNEAGPVYTLILNILGGCSYIFHGASTWNFKLAKPANRTDVLDEQLTLPKPMPNLAVISAYYIIFLSLWNGLMTVGFFIYLPQAPAAVVIPAGIYLFSFVLIPLIVVSKNLSTHNDIYKINQKIKMVQLAAKLKAKNTPKQK